MHTTTLVLGLVASSVVATAAAAPLEWVDRHDVKSHPKGWEATGVDPFLVTRLAKPATEDEHCLLLDLHVSQPVQMQVLWSGAQPVWRPDCILTIPVAASPEVTTIAINLNQQDTFRGAEHVRIDFGTNAGVVFDVSRVSLVAPREVPEHLLPGLIGFHCFTSKLHYLPKERIEFRMRLNADCYPDRQSAKVLDLRLVNDRDETVATQFVQYGLRPMNRVTEVQGVLELEEVLPVGRYTLHAKSRDLRSGRALTAQHVFGVQGKDDPFVYETPFKFVKDFSIVRGPDDRWHVFSITGDFFANHDWMPDGQERTFSHGSSADLRHWTMHRPVISVSNQTYPDGRGYFKNRNVWAPHIIKHDGKYWMFYTSVNEHVSQSISLATSEDLFDWTEYEHNPVFNLEGVEWADWGRDRWADCRDACVLKDGDRFYMYVTASAKPPGDRGAVVVAESDDLKHWRNPAIAVRRNIISESPQVWKDGGRYCMTTSSLGGTTYISDDPVTGWKPHAFPRPPIRAEEAYVDTSSSYAEEVVRLADGRVMMVGLTWRHWGNSLYLFRLKSKDGIPVGYESPWDLSGR